MFQYDSCERLCKLRDENMSQGLGVALPVPKEPCCWRLFHLPSQSEHKGQQWSFFGGESQKRFLGKWGIAKYVEEEKLCSMPSRWNLCQQLPIRRQHETRKYAKVSRFVYKERYDVSIFTSCTKSTPCFTRSGWFHQKVWGHLQQISQRIKQAWWLEVTKMRFFWVKDVFRDFFLPRCHLLDFPQPKK